MGFRVLGLSVSGWVWAQGLDMLALGLGLRAEGFGLPRFRKKRLGGAQCFMSSGLPIHEVLVAQCPDLSGGGLGLHSRHPKTHEAAPEQTV